ITQSAGANTSSRILQCLIWDFDSRLIYRIILSALAKTLGGIVNRICFAVFRLITNSNFVGCSTGRSAGFLPCRILSTIDATRLEGSDWSAPYDIKPPLSTKSARE